ncbi:hypothetical protein ABIE12_004458 [Serratia sp. 509]
MVIPFFYGASGMVLVFDEEGGGRTLISLSYLSNTREGGFVKLPSLTAEWSACNAICLYDFIC